MELSDVIVPSLVELEIVVSSGAEIVEVDPAGGIVEGSPFGSRLRTAAA